MKRLRSFRTRVKWWLKYGRPALLVHVWRGRKAIVGFGEWRDVSSWQGVWFHNTTLVLPKDADAVICDCIFTAKGNR